MIRRLHPLAFSLLVCSCATAEEKDRNFAGARLQFVANVQSVEPAKPFTLALHIQHGKGFHTYWNFPGIVGIPPTFEWKLPPGFKIGEVHWPSPKIVDMATHPAHGYHRDVFLLMKVTPPKELKQEKVTLTADLAWMCCSRTLCRPGFEARSLTLPVNRTGQEVLDPKWSPLIEKERAGLPVATDLWKLRVETPKDSSKIRLRLSPARAEAGDPGDVYFFSEDGQITSEPPQKVTRQEDGSYLIEADRSEFSPKGNPTIPGTLVASGSWSREGTLKAFRANPSYPK